MYLMFGHEHEDADVVKRFKRASSNID